MIPTNKMPSTDLRTGGTQNEIQIFNNKQIYTKGFVFNTVANQDNEFPIVLNGNARQLYGITLFVDVNFMQDADIVNLSINEENVITNVVWWNFTPSGGGPMPGNNFKKHAFFPIHRSLSGNDSIQLVWRSLNAHKIYPIFWISNSVQPGME